MPKIYPLFNLEGDNLYNIPSLFGLDLITKLYNSNQSSGGGNNNNNNTPLANSLENPLA